MIEMAKCQAPVLSNRQSVFRRQNTRQVDKEEADNTQKHSREIGKVVARDFGEAGVFRGEIVGVEYDSEDEGKVEPVYVVAYWNEVYDSIMAEQCSLVIKDDMKEYERMAKEHDEKQTFIKEQLIEAIKAYNCMTYRQLAGHINNWCQHTCIMNWLHSHETYSLYAKTVGVHPYSCYSFAY
jgi:hypothetical protein